MPSYFIDGLVFDDVNKSGHDDPGDPGVFGALLTVTGDASGSGVSLSDGTCDLSFDDGRPGPLSVTVTCTPPTATPPWQLTTPASVNLTLTAGVHSDVAFGLTRRECFRRGSSRVDRVCWLPGQGVQVQFKNRRGTPCFCCYYPGTTYQDYLAFLAAPSLGRHVWEWYYRRPYVTVPVGS
jgi:hypothetical protein